MASFHSNICNCYLFKALSSQQPFKGFVSFRRLVPTDNLFGWSLLTSDLPICHVSCDTFLARHFDWPDYYYLSTFLLYFIFSLFGHNWVTNSWLVTRAELQSKLMKIIISTKNIAFYLPYTLVYQSKIFGQFLTSMLVANFVIIFDIFVLFWQKRINVLFNRYIRY